MALMYCRECGKQVSSEASNCPHCGVPRPVLPAPAEYQAQPPVYYAPPKRHDPVVAALLSLFLPGVGQMYKGEVGIGIALLIGTIIGYMACVVPGIVLHIVAIVHAAQDRW